MRTLRPLFLAVLLLTAIRSAEAQAIRFDSVASTTSAACASGKQCPILALPGTQVNVCGGTVTTLSTCLATPATTYTNAGAGTACATTSQLTPQTGGACLATADSQGNFGFWILPGSYNYFLRVPTTAGGGTYGPYPINVGSGVGCPMGATCDANYATLALACAAAGNGTLYVTRAWNSTPTGSCPTIDFLGNGKVTMAAGAALTINPDFSCGEYQQCFNVGASGSSFLFTGVTPTLNPNWFGADPTCNADSKAAFVSAMAASKHISIPDGSYCSSAAIPVQQSGQSITGSVGQATTITFSGATDGFQIGTGKQQINMADVTILTTNAGAGAAIAMTGASGSHIFTNVRILNSGAGAWDYGWYAPTDVESSAFYSPFCFSVKKCISLNGTSNANSIHAPLITGVYTTGLEIATAQDTQVFGGVIQGNAATALVTTTGGVRMYGTWLENSGTTPALISTSGSTLAGVILDGVNYSIDPSDDAFRFSGPGSVYIRGITGSASAPGCVINHLGDNASATQPSNFTVADSTVFNFNAAGHGICVGASGNFIVNVKISGNWISTAQDGITLSGTSDMHISADSNRIKSISSGYAFLMSGSPQLTYNFNKLEPVDGACGGSCTGTETRLGNEINGSPLGNYLVLPPTVSAWGVAHFLTVANGVSGCASANGCMLVTKTNSSTSVTALPAAAALTNLVFTPAIPYGFLGALRIHTTTACTGSTGLGVHRIGDATSASSILVLSPDYDLTAAASDTNIYNLQAPVPGLTIASSQVYSISLVVGSGTVDQTNPGCAFDVYALTSSNQ